MSSGNPERRPAGAKPARSRVSPPGPVASLAAFPATGALMRRHANVWAVGHAASKPMTSRAPRALDPLKATADSPKWARRDPHPAGSSTTARAKRTAQQPGRPLLFPEEVRSHGDPVNPLRRAACPRAHALPAPSGAQKKRPRRGRPKARDDRSRGRREQGSRRAAYELRRRGTGMASGPGRAKAARVDVSSRRDP